MPPSPIRYLTKGYRPAVPTAVELLDKRITTAIGETGVTTHSLDRILSALVHLDLLQVRGFRQMCILWIGVILGSTRPDRDKYLLAGDAVTLLASGRRDNPEPPESLNQVQPAELPLLLDFLLLSEKYYLSYDPPYPGTIALRLLSLSYSIGCGDLNQRLVSVLTSTLSETHPLLSRLLALKLFQEHGSEWLSLSMERFAEKGRAKLLKELGDPFHFPSTSPSSDAENLPMVQVTYEPMDTAVLLIEFASSGLWGDHLRPQNFSSCEEIVSTAWGRHLASNCMLNKKTYFGGEPLETPARLVAAIECLEKLQCWNIAEVVILYAWTSGVMGPANRDAWRLIGRETQKFYHLRGKGRLGTLARGIKARYMHKELGGDVSCRVGGVQRPIRLATGSREKGSRAKVWPDARHIHRACQLKRLYQFLGYDHTTVDEVVATARAADDVLSGSGSETQHRRVITPTKALYLACDYP